MYKIQKASGAIISAYAHDIALKLLPLIQAYLNGKILQIAIKNRGTANITLKKDSLTYRFLISISTLDKLKEYLLWSHDRQCNFINKLHDSKYPDDLIFKKLGARTYDLYYNAASLDHFNEIVYDIFVNGIYDNQGNPPAFDKRQFINNSGLRVCPYCGAEMIKPTTRTKRQIDHFLPKREYPLFALSYYNLIPCCDKCNESPNKGPKDPIKQEKMGFKIVTPYRFDNNCIRFNVDLLGVDLFQDSNYSLIVGFSEQQLLNGYDRFFDISDRYSDCSIEAGNTYRKLVSFHAQDYYKKMSIDANWLKSEFDAVMGYSPLNSKPSIQQYYSMCANVFIQYFGLRKRRPFFTKRKAGGTELMG